MPQVRSACQQESGCSESATPPPISDLIGSTSTNKRGSKQLRGADGGEWEDQAHTSDRVETAAEYEWPTWWIVMSGPERSVSQVLHCGAWVMCYFAERSTYWIRGDDCRLWTRLLPIGERRLPAEDGQDGVCTLADCDCGVSWWRLFCWVTSECFSFCYFLVCDVFWN